MGKQAAFIRPRARKKKDSGASTEEAVDFFHGSARSALMVVLHWGLLPLVLTIVVGVLLFQLAVVRPASRHSSMYSAAVIGNAVDHVSQELRFLRVRLHQQASNAQVIAALTDNDSAALQTLETDLALQVPEAIGLRLLPLDWHTVDTSGKLPISNITLDTLRQLRKEGKAAPELINAGRANAHFLLAELVKKEDRPIGFLLAGIKVAVTQDALTALQGTPGFLELSQEVDSVQQVVATRGDTALKSGDADVQSDIADSHWRLSYWNAPSESSITSTLLAIYWGGLLLIISAIAVAVWRLIHALDTAQHQDGARLLKAILEAHNKGERIAPEGYHLDVFQDIAVTLSRIDWSAGNAHAPVAAAPITPVPALPLSLNQPFGNIAAPEIKEVTRSTVSPDIFRAYDIRGIVGETLNAEIVRLLGRAIGSEAFDRGEQRVAVARDGRTHGPELLEALKEGLMESGRDVIDLGAVPTPLLYFATHYLSTRSGVMLTGSHNPANYNGLKIVIAGETLSGDDIQRLRERIEQRNLLSGSGSQESVHIVDDYIGQITGDVALAQPLKIVIDCGNGIAGAIAPALYQALGCEVIPLYCEVDGRFPNHHPDPSKPENLKELIAAVKQHDADIGLAFDGDGDRLGVVDSDGKIIWPDRQMMLYSMDVLSRHPGTDIIYDVKCSRHLARVISGHGGRPIMWRTGHSLIKRKMRETGALLAGECSGHVFFKERWYGFDDALYTGARLLEILAADFRKSAEVFRSLPEGVTTPELNVPMADNRKHAYVEQLARVAQILGGETTTIDGIRIDFPDGWGLVRASNTTPCLVVRFEADDEAGLQRMKDLFREQMLTLDPALKLPF